MGTNKTVQELASITDEGLFERLATAILREANPAYCNIIHTGVNVEGKTIKSPLDGICFVQGVDPPHMIAVHHTTTASNNLEKKWLHDPTQLKARKDSSYVAHAGDLVKTAELVAKERIRTPNLCVTLVLTTNKEPSEELVRTIEAAGRNRDIKIDLWSRSRLSHFLDQPAGQWIRCKYLGMEEVLLTSELLRKLSTKSLETFSPMDNPAAWVPRTLDRILSTNRRGVTFLMAESGMGKSVACYRKLAAHVRDGGFGIILPHEAVSSGLNIDEVITTALRQLHPSLSRVGVSALSLCSPENPMLLVVEDINRSGQAPLLIEKLARWDSVSATQLGPSRWCLLCPLWPEILASLGDQARKRIEPLIIVVGGFTATEGRDAVLARARLHDRNFSFLDAEEISMALGHDPLLIALHDQENAPTPDKIISMFIEGCLSSVAATAKDLPAEEYRHALRALAGEMLVNRQLELSWSEVRIWSGMQTEHLRLIGRIAHDGELIRLIGNSDDQHLVFRHDRVRDWLLSDTVAELDLRDLLPEQVIAEPYFSEVMGSTLAFGEPKKDFLQLIAYLNPLALFHAFRLCSQSNKRQEESILQAIEEWLDNPSTHCRSNLHLRWEALATLAQTDSLNVPALIQKFHDRTLSSKLAKLRNGDLSGGIELCAAIEPGINAPWRDIQIEHAKANHGSNLSNGLDGLLRQKDIDRDTKTGALRLAGHIADPNLAPAIEACWNLDSERVNYLADYLWAFAQCCANTPEHFLGPVCSAWAELPDQPTKAGSQSPRYEIAANELRWAFEKWPPFSAIDYLIQRGSQDDLRGPITYLLQGMDYPKAVSFVVHELAAIQGRVKSAGSFSTSLMWAREQWRRAQEDYGRPMSKPSRDLLLALWQDDANDKHLRAQAFSLWAATHDSYDVEVLRSAKPSDELADKVLIELLIRGDQRAIPELIAKLEVDEKGYWWHYSRNLWSPELTGCLDEYLGKRGERIRPIWGESLDSDLLTHEAIMRLPTDEAERILLKHWPHLRFEPHFFQTALFISTPRTLEAVRTTINECPEPAKLMKHVSFHFGISMNGHSDITRQEQVLALAPYLKLLSPEDLRALWNLCNERGWFSMRNELLDDLLQPVFLPRRWDRTQVASQLDKFVEEDFIWIDHWIDDYLKTGISWDEILRTMSIWLDERRSFQALKLVAAALEHHGSRKDLGILATFEDSTESLFRELVSDMRFAMRRRSLH